MKRLLHFGIVQWKFILNKLPLNEWLQHCVLRSKLLSYLNKIEKSCNTSVNLGKKLLSQQLELPSIWSWIAEIVDFFFKWNREFTYFKKHKPQRKQNMLTHSIIFFQPPWIRFSWKRRQSLEDYMSLEQSILAELLHLWETLRKNNFKTFHAVFFRKRPELKKCKLCEF